MALSPLKAALESKIFRTSLNMCAIHMDNLERNRDRTIDPGVA